MSASTEAPSEPAPSQTDTQAQPAPAKSQKPEAEPKGPKKVDLKAQKKAEKAAKRAQQKEAQGPVPNGIAQPAKAEQHHTAQTPTTKRGATQEPSSQKPPKAQQAPTKHKLTPQVESKPARREPAPVGLFAHLYGQPRRHSLEGAAKEVHPAILALGLQMSSYEVCGSSARCVAMLLAFKSVIQSYTTPPGTSLARHLTNHYLSPQIDYLKSCRPLSTSMGNAIRWLKDLIIKIDPDVPEGEAKADLLANIDGFVRERITAADAVIAAAASAKIVHGDVVLTYAASSIVQKTLLAAHAAGTRFSVVVVDSKPLFEGRRLASTLAAHGLAVQYTLVSAAAHAVDTATKVFVGAAAMLSNGMLYSRVGTAVVAMLAHERDIPVIVCCESVKFSDQVALESITKNEVAPWEELLAERGEGEGKADERQARLRRWEETPNLQILNVLYDVTPAQYIRMVVTEAGSLPPSAIPAVRRALGET